MIIDLVMNREVMEAPLEIPSGGAGTKQMLVSTVLHSIVEGFAVGC